MKGTIALIIVIFQSILFWMAWTGDSVRHDKQNAKFEARIYELSSRCDSLEVVVSTLSMVEADTVIVNVPAPIVKIINSK